MAQKNIQTSIQINASPERVWKVLTDFESYYKWNPFILAVEGKVSEGEQIKINAGGMKFSPIVLKFEKNKQLKWLGKLLFKGLFDGEHNFIIEDNQNGTVTFKHEEYFSGILVGLFANKLDADTKEGFIAMNKKLKELAENLESL